MKKSIRAVLLVFLSMVLIFASVTSVWGGWEQDKNWNIIVKDGVATYNGWPAPDPRKAIEQGIFRTWRDSKTDDLGSLSAFAELWYFSFTFEDGKIWDQLYLDHFEKKLQTLSDRNYWTPWISDINYNGATWYGRNLTVDISADVSIKHSKYYDDYFSDSWVYDKNVDGYLVNTIVITEKKTGKVVDMGAAGYYDVKYADWWYESNKVADVPEDAALEYTTTADGTTAVSMHAGFNPAIHDITLYVTYVDDFISLDPFTVVPPVDVYSYVLWIVDFRFIEAFPIDTSGCYMPTGDVDGNGITNLRDVSTILRHIAKWELDGFNKTEADLDCDGTIDLFDARMGMKIACGWDLTK